MKEIVRSIYEYTTEYFGESVFLVAAVIFAIYLLLTDKKKYLPLIAPMILICLIIFNPVSYILVLSKTRFWRLLWMFPLGLYSLL